jgi:hypothetical protein
MADERKSILLRIPPELWEQINRLAQSELRSTNAQMEFLLREALKARGAGGDKGGAGGAGGAGKNAK